MALLFLWMKDTCNISCILKSISMVVISNFHSNQVVPIIFVSITLNMTQKYLKITAN
jgi:hypothetical protein